MRTGLIARKVGSSRIFTDDGSHIPVTLLQVEACQVVSHRTQDKHGYDALQLGVEAARPNRMNKAERGHFAKASVAPKKKLAEFRISSDAFVDVGAELTVEHFVSGQRVDVSGTSIGKGFAGVMKRHNFSGMRASHGVSVSHRAHGSTGHCQEPGKVFKGKKMAGQMGNKRATVQNLEIVSVDDDRGVLFIKGAIPGAKEAWIEITDAVKVSMPEDAPVPAGIRRSADAAAAADAPEGEAPDLATSNEVSDRAAPVSESADEASAAEEPKS